MKKITFLCLLSFVLFACNKNSDARKSSTDSICYTGKIIAKGCYGNAIIQVLKPQEAFLKESVYKNGNDQPLLEYVISTNVPLPNEYSAGDQFYFQVKEFSVIGATTAECIWPKYSAEIQSMSKHSCDSITSK